VEAIPKVWLDTS